VLHLKKRKPDTWARTDKGDTPDQTAMYQAGKIWSEENASCKEEVCITNDGLNLYGEYYDFGYEKAVIIVPGRSDSLTYSYYFAEPYKKSGYNVLVIDMRAHGKSDGKYNYLGFREYKDLIAWMEFLRDEHQVKSVVFHALCVGAQSVLKAITAEECPKIVEAFVVEGMYTTFYETFKNHTIYLGHKPFPVVPLMEVWMRLFTHNTIFYGPICIIDQMKVPMLMLHGKEDIFSLPKKAEELYEACSSPVKELVWFDKGVHSQLRLSNTEEYDKAIELFLRRL
jgi:alpha-beta hydrolase superfamily lysophospholipase